MQVLKLACFKMIDPAVDGDGVTLAVGYFLDDTGRCNVGDLLFDRFDGLTRERRTLCMTNSG